MYNSQLNAAAVSGVNALGLAPRLMTKEEFEAQAADMEARRVEMEKSSRRWFVQEAVGNLYRAGELVTPETVQQIYRIYDAVQEQAQ